MPSPANSSSRGKFLDQLILGALILWAAVLFYHYFPAKETFNLSFVREFFSNPGLLDGNKFLENSLGSLRIFFTAFFILFTLWRWGRRALHWIGLNPGNILLRFSMEMGLGILLFNSLWLGLGLNGLWFRPFLVTLILMLMGLALLDFFRNFMKFQKMPRVDWPGWLPLSLAGLGFLFLGLSAAQGLLPEIYYDGLVYHLATLSFWTFHHGIADFYTNLYSYYPFGAELYFFPGYFLQGGETAKMLNVFSSVLCALAAAGWVMEEAGASYGCFAWALVLFFPWVTSTVWTTQNDILLAFFFLLFYYALFRWAREKEASRWALAVGIFGGAVLTVKYTAVIGIAAGLLAFGLTGRDVLSPRRKSGWGWVLLLMGFSLAPWALKNFVYAGNGIYPYLSSWMGGRTLSSEKMAALMNDHQSAFQYGFSLADWLGRIFTRDLDKTIAPILFSFFPIFFLPGQRRPVTKYWGALAVMLFLSGFLVSHLLRLMIPAFLICFLWIVLTLADLKKKQWIHWGAGVLLLFGCLSFLSLCRLSISYFHGDQIWLGKKTRQEYLASPPQTASYMDLTQAASRLPESDRLLIVGDSRGLYYPRSFYANSVFDNQVLARLAVREKDGEAIGRSLRKMGIEDLVVTGHEGSRLARQYAYYPLQEPEWKKLDDFIQRHTELIYLKGLNGIYRVRTAPVERKGPVPNLLNLLKTPLNNPEKVL